MNGPGKKIAIVTGASGGLGKEFVKLLLKEKNIDEIWAIAKNEEKLIRLQTDCGEKIKIFPTDLSSIKAIEDFSFYLKEHDPDILFLINNAGFAKFCSYNDLSIEESVNMIDLNCNAVVAMGLMCIPYIKAGGHILNIASAAAFLPLPYQNIYSSTKAFVRNYSRALNIELKDKAISVTAVCPGWINTPLLERAQIGAAKATRYFAGMVTAGKVAHKALKDAKKRKDMSIYGSFTKFFHVVSKLLPQSLLIKIWLRQQKL